MKMKIEAEGNAELDVDDENSSLTRASHQLMEAVANHIVNCYCRVVNKPQAISMAKTFRKLIVRFSRLFIHFRAFYLFFHLPSPLPSLFPPFSPSFSVG